MTSDSFTTSSFRSRHRRGGFTLLELMLSMIIVATLVPVLYSAMHAGFNAKAHAEAAVEPARTVELSIDLLRQDLEGALPPSGVLAGTFVGTNGTDDRNRDADDLIFYSTADSPQHAVANGDIKQIELSILTTSTGDHVLVRKVTRNLLSQQAGIPDVEVICRGVGGFNLRYFDGSNWADTWASTQQDNTIPAAVEITLTLDRPNGNTLNVDQSRSFRSVRIIPLSCSTAAFDSAVNAGATQ